MSKQKKCFLYEDGIHRGLCGCGAEVEQVHLKITPELIEEVAIAMYASFEVITVAQAKKPFKWAAESDDAKDEYRWKAEAAVRWTLKKLGAKLR